MSLDVYLIGKTTIKKGSTIFIRENGSIREISREDWDSRFPGREPAMIDIVETNDIYHANITHNLNKMAMAAGLYEPIWRPEEIGITHAKHLIQPLEEGLVRLMTEPEEYKKFDASNGWGTYEQFVPFVEKYLKACEENPEAEVVVSR